MAQTRGMQLCENEDLKSLKSEAKKQRNAAIEAMTQQLETDTQPDGVPYTVLADHLTDRTTFIQGLRNAGFEIQDENILVVPFRDPDAVIVTFASGAHAKRAMLALHLRDFRGMEGRKMGLTKASPQVVGPDYRDPYAPVPIHCLVVQAMAETFRERTVASRRAWWAELEAVKLAKDVNKLKNKRKQEEARLAKQAKKAANIKMAQEAKLAADLRKAEKRKKAENVVRDVRKVEGATQAKDAKDSAKTVEEMEETRRAKDDAKAAKHLAKRMAEMEAWVAKRLRKEANIKRAREEKSAADLRKEAKRVQHVKWVEEGKLRKKANMMAQQSGGFCDDCFFEGMHDVEAVAGGEPEIGAWFEAMKQQHRDMEELKTALVGCDALLADMEGIQWDAVTRVCGIEAGESMEGVVE